MINNQCSIFIHSNINHSKGCHSCESRNPEKHLIPPYQVRGKLSQARNDKLNESYVVMYNRELKPQPLGCVIFGVCKKRRLTISKQRITRSKICSKLRS